MTKQIQTMKTKSDIFPWDIYNYDIIFQWSQYSKYFNDFYDWHLLISRNIDHKQLKWKKIKQDMYISESIFPNLQSITVFEWLLKLISW